MYQFCSQNWMCLLILILFYLMCFILLVGAMIVAFEDHEAAVAAYNALKEVIYEEKPLTLLFIPEIHVSYRNTVG